MSDEGKTSNHYNPINKKENQGKTRSKQAEKARVIIDYMEEEERQQELQRRARIEYNHKMRIKRIQNYQMRLTFMFVGVGMFALLSGYSIGAIMHGENGWDESAVMADGVIMGSATSDGVIYQDWKLRLVNAWNPLNIVSYIELTTLENGLEVDARIEEPLLEMIEAGRKEAGLDIIVCSAYRSKEYQTKLFNERIEEQMVGGSSYWEAYEMVCEETALPGTSEHELGLAVDLVGRDYQNLDAKQGTTAVAIWLEENCHRFGFILRYPEGKESVTGIYYESWHFRYVGEQVAKYIMENNITLEEYLDN